MAPLDGKGLGGETTAVKVPYLVSQAVRVHGDHTAMALSHQRIRGIPALRKYRKRASRFVL